METLLKIENLSKTFGDFKAVDTINLMVEPGEIYGFLGPNGAGKTTTIKMIVGLLQPDNGEVLIGEYNLEQEPKACKSITGYIPDRPFLYEKLTGDEYLRFVCSLYPEAAGGKAIKNAEHYLDLFDLSQWRHHLIEGYSHGMRQKLIMTSILILEQPLIVVDEPMVGLDPKSAKIVKELFRNKADQGAAVFLSTHSMEIAEELCDRIGILVDGSIKATGTIKDLRQIVSTGEKNLEDIFLELTGAFELQEVIRALKSPQRKSSSGQPPIKKS